MGNKKMKICFVASSGGHYEQLLMLEPLMNKYDSFIVTEKTKYKTPIQGKKMYYLFQVNRKEVSFLWKMIANIFNSFWILCVENPDVVVSTGVLATIPICLLAKLFGKKLVYIESFAKVTSGTETGKLLYRFADQFYVQWKSMLKVYPKAIYKGRIY